MKARSYHFGDYHLDPATRELFHAGQPVALPPKSFDCIVYLIEHRERAVGRDELISAVWGRVDVNDALLAQTLLRARRAVGDSGSGQTAIRTVPRFGYRWIAIIETVSAIAVQTTPAAADATSQTSVFVPEAAIAGVAFRSIEVMPEQPPRIHAATDIAARRIAKFAWIAALLLLSIAAFGYWRFQALKPVAASADLIVVLPVTLPADVADSAWIRLGVMDYVASRLRQNGQLTVLPSERVVALFGDKNSNGGDDGEQRQRIGNSAGAGILIQPEAHTDAGGWHIVLNLFEDGRKQVYSGKGDSPLIAAGRAADALLAQISRAPKNLPASAPTRLTELVQRVDAALLDGDVVTARQLVTTAPTELRADAVVQVREGQIAFRAGQLDEAQHQFGALQDRLAQLPVDVQAQSLMGLGAVALRRGDFPNAEHRYAEALAALGPNGIPELAGDGYNGRGAARTAQGQFDTALADFGRARVAFERAGDSPSAAAVDTNLSLLEARRKHWAPAVAAADRAIVVFERYGVHDYLAASLLTKANAQLALLDLNDALDTSSHALALAKKLEDPKLIEAITHVRIESLLATGQLHDAETLLANAQASPTGNSSAMQALRVRLALARGDGKLALGLMQPLFAAEKTPDAADVQLFVRAALTAGDEAGALRALPATVDASRTTDNDDATLEYARALVAEATADTIAADRHFARARAAADRDGTPAERVQIGSSYIRFLIAQQELDRATAIAGELAPFAEHDLRATQASVLLYRTLGEQTLLDVAQKRARALAGERDPERFAF